MLEGNIKTRSIYIERKTPKGKWVRHSTIHNEKILTLDEINDMLIIAKDYFPAESDFNTPFRATTLKGTQLLTSQGGYELLSLLSLCSLFTVFTINSDLPEIYANNNVKFPAVESLAKEFVKFGGIKRFVSRRSCFEDNEIITGDIFFKNSSKMSIGFYNKQIDLIKNIKLKSNT